MKIIEKLPCHPYEEITGNSKVKAFLAFQSTKLSNPGLVAELLKRVDEKRAQNQLNFNFDFSPYNKSGSFQIPQTPEAFCQARDALMQEGVEVCLRYLNSHHLNIDLRLDKVGNAPEGFSERVMNSPHKPTIVDIVDYKDTEHYLNSIKHRYSRMRLESSAEGKILRSAETGIVRCYQIRINERPEWLRVLLSYDPSNKAFEDVTADKLLQLLTEKDQCTLPEIKDKRAHLLDTQKIDMAHACAQ